MVEIPDDVAREHATWLRGPQSTIEERELADLLDPPPPEPDLVDRMTNAFVAAEVGEGMNAALAVVRAAVEEEVPKRGWLANDADSIAANSARGYNKAIDDVLALLDGGEK